VDEKGGYLMKGRKFTEGSKTATQESIWKMGGQKTQVLSHTGLLEIWEIIIYLAMNRIRAYYIVLILHGKLKKRNSCS
jgi:hypothetical protein